MERRLELISAELKKVQEEKENTVSQGPKTSEELKGKKTPDISRNDGKTNSRQVLEMLQKEEKKQEKVHKKLPNMHFIKNNIIDGRCQTQINS